jgi:hypothetical protein
MLPTPSGAFLQRTRCLMRSCAGAHLRHGCFLAEVWGGLKRLTLCRRDLSLANCCEMHDSALDSLAHTLRRLQHAAPDPADANFGTHAAPPHDADLKAAGLASHLGASRFFVEVCAACKRLNPAPSASFSPVPGADIHTAVHCKLHEQCQQ